MQLTHHRRVGIPAACESIDADDFAALLDPLGPFEPAPHLAVAVSGGRDSLALCLFADEWARRRGGRITALTVDHGLRAASGREAALVGSWLRARAIAHEVLGIPASPPASGVEAWARERRYARLEAWCRRHGVLHLLVAHHREDQGETWLMRTARGTGPAGAAAMPAVRELTHTRVLRPLLGVARARLTATLAARGVPWIEDPMNRDRRFDRVALRLGAADAAGEYEFTDAAAAAASAGRHRAGDDAALARLAGRCTTVDPAGFVTLARAALAAAEPAAAARLLARCVGAVGGQVYPPRRAGIARLAEYVRGPGPLAGRTLAGCRVLAGGSGDKVMVCREPAAVAPTIRVPASDFRWDGRFAVATAAGGAEGYTVGALGAAGWRALAPIVPRSAVPVPVRETLPALFLDGTPVSVPALGLHRAGAPGFSARFAPPVAVAGAPFGNAPLSFDV